jgi:hypothetical protein
VEQKKKRGITRGDRRFGNNNNTHISSCAAVIMNVIDEITY